MLCVFLPYNTSKVDVIVQGWRGACCLEAMLHVLPVLVFPGPGPSSRHVHGGTEGSTLLFLG